MSFSVEVVRRVFDDNEGVCISVGPDTDGLGCVRVWTEGINAEHFGSIDMTLEPGMAREIGKAMIAAADEAK